MIKYTITVQHLDNAAETYTTKSLKQAYKMYDNAIVQGYAVLSFTTDTGADLADRKGEV